MQNLFIYECGVEQNPEGSTQINIFRVELVRKSKKTYSINFYQDKGYIRLNADKSIEHSIKDLFTIRYLNLLYCKNQTTVVSKDLVEQLILNHKKVEREE